MTGEILISAGRVVKKYGALAAVGGIDLEVGRGMIYGVAGLNGAGKSTLLAILAGVLRPDAGEVLYRGVPVYAGGRGRRGLRVGYVPQEIALFADLSVYDNLKFWALAARPPASPSPLRERLLSAAAVAGLSDKLRERVAHLSGGMKRRVNIAAALAAEPEALIMDEPTAGLDVKNRRDILGFIKELAKDRERGPAVICTSHQSGELETVSDRLLLLDSGRAVYDGPPDGVFSGAFNGYGSVDDILYALASDTLASDTPTNAKGSVI